MCNDVVWKMHPIVALQHALSQSLPNHYRFAARVRSGGERSVGAPRIGVGDVSFLPIRPIFALVGVCALVAGFAGSHTAGAATETKAAETPRPLIKFDHAVVFTMALGEPATNAKVAALMAGRLHDNGKNNAGPVRSDAWIVPMGQWSLADYLDQCKRDPAHTRGAFIVLPPSSASSSDNYIALLRSTTDVTLSIMVAECRPPSASATPAPESSGPPGGDTTIAWASYAQSGKYGRSQIEFFPLAVLTSVYLAFSPQRTYQTTTTTVYPTVAPIPPSGERSSVQVQQSSILNPSGTAGLQGNVLGAFAGNGLGSTIGGQSAPETQAVRAADDAIGHLLHEQLNRVCAAANPRGGTPPPLALIASAPEGSPAPSGDHPFCSW